MKKKYDRTGQDFSSENSKYMAKKGKEEDLQESADSVAITRQAYHAATLNLVARLNEIMAQKDVHLVESLVGLFQVRQEMVQKQQSQSADLQAFLDKVNRWSCQKRSELEKMISETEVKKQEILQKHADFYNPTTTVIDESSPERSGYLYKKSSHTMVRPVWCRRFFRLKEHTLEYFTQDEDKTDSETILIDLRLCLIRPIDNGERRFTFEIMSPLKYFYA